MSLRSTWPPSIDEGWSSQYKRIARILARTGTLSHSKVSSTEESLGYSMCGAELPDDLELEYYDKRKKDAEDRANEGGGDRARAL